jgi:hypothetical protein
MTILVSSCSERSPSNAPPSSPPLKDTAPEEAARPAPDLEKMVFEGPGLLLPKKALDLELSSSPRYFGPSNLFDLINGGAEIYAEFGLKKMVTADYRSPARKDKTVTLEIYDQGSPLGAFGRTARFLAGREDPSKAGEGLPGEIAERGLFGGTDIVYWKDRYLVHVTLLDESPDATLESMKTTARELLPPFAEAVAAKITSNPPLPPLLAAFPTAGRLARSEAWETKDLAGIDGLGAGFTVRYRAGDKAFSLFASMELGGADEAAAKVEALGAAAGEKATLIAAGDRAIGYTSTEQSWTSEDHRRAMAAVKELEEKLVSQ